MNRHDILLLITLLVIIFGSIIYMFSNKTNSKTANIYYENKIILTVDLTISKEQKFIVKGYNGNVNILSKKGKIKVISEKSNRHICSKQGYISSSYQSIVCLPNKIIIKIEDNKKIDTIVG